VIALLIANSLALASLLIMLASGLALIYGLRDVINFGHGAIYMLGAYLGYTVALVGGLNPSVRDLSLLTCKTAMSTITSGRALSKSSTNFSASAI